MASRVSQVVIESLVIPVPKARASQVAIEAAVLFNPHARVSQTVVEAAVIPVPHARLSQVVIEVAVGPVTHTPTNVNITLVDTITVAQTITERDDTSHQAVTSTIAVAQIITAFGDRHVTVAHAINVTPTATGRDDTNRQTVSHSVSVTPLLTSTGGRAIVSITVTDNIGVSQTVGERNTNVRLTVADSIGVASPGSETTDHPNMTDNVTVTSTATANTNNKHLTVTQPITVGNIVSYFSPRLTVMSGIALTEQVSVRSTNVRLTVADEITVADSASGYINPVRITVVDNILIPQNFPGQWPATARVNKVRTTVTDSMTVSTSIAGGPSLRRIAMTDTGTVTDTIRCSFQYQTVRTNVTVSDRIIGQSYNETVSHSIHVTPNIADHGNVYRITVADNILVTTTRTPRTPRVPETVADSINVLSKVTQRIAPRTQVVTSAITVTPGIVVAGPRHLTVTDNVTVTPTFRDREARQRLTDTVHVDDRMRTLWIIMHDRITVDQKAYQIFNADITDTLPLTQSVSRQATRIRRVTDDLPMTQIARRGAVYTRDVVDTLVFPSLDFQRTYSFWPFPFTIPVVHGGKMANLVVLKAKSDTITLPAAVLGDSKANTDKITVQRSMNGKTMTIIQTNDRQILKLSFRVSLKKSLELRKFVIANIAELIQLTDWNGAVWMGRFTSNPFPLEHAGRSVTEQEFVTFEIDFEGAKISG